MGRIPHPTPPSLAALRARWDAGARTVEELDPELYAWHRERRRWGRLGTVVMVFGYMAVLAFVVLVAMAR